jgi:hypothetical protein
MTTKVFVPICFVTTCQEKSKTILLNLRTKSAKSERGKKKKEEVEILSSCPKGIKMPVSE